MKFIFFSSFLLFFVGCASINESIQVSTTGVNKSITGPDGSPHELIKCSEVEICYKKAAEVCNGKYKIVDNSTSSIVYLLVKCGG